MPSVIEYRLNIKIDGREYQKDSFVGRIEAEVMRTFEVLVPDSTATIVFPVPTVGADPIPALTARLLVLIPDHDCILIKSSFETIGVLSAGAPFFMPVSGLDSGNSYILYQTLGFDIHVKGLVAA